MDIFSYAFMQKALIAAFFVSIACAVLGVFLVLRRMSMLADGIAHASFGGIALGILFNINPLVSALGFSTLVAFGIEKLKSVKIYGDVGITMFFTLGLALGIMVLASAGHGNVDVISFLFGSIVSISDFDLAMIITLSVASVVLVFLFFKQFLYATFDEEGAFASGINTRLFNYLFSVIAALVVVASIRIAGVLLVSALTVIPAAIAVRVSRSFSGAITSSATIGLASMLLGIILSFYLDVPASAMVVIILFSALMAFLAIKKI